MLAVRHARIRPMFIYQVSGILCSASAMGLGVLKADCKPTTGTAGISASSGIDCKRSTIRSITSCSSFGESALETAPPIKNSVHGVRNVLEIGSPESFMAIRVVCSSAWWVRHSQTTAT